jgi:hypothetical protein
MLCKFIRRRGHTHNRTKRLHAVIHRTNPRTQPDRVRRSLDEFGIEDDELGTAEGCLETVFPAGVVLGAAGEIGIFACREGGWDGDDGDGGRVDLGAFVGAFGEAFEV